MGNAVKKRIYPQNPLGIIALFVFFIEAISTVSLKLMITGNSPFVGHLVWFIILYPSVIALLFFITLWWKRESFYSPSDFENDGSFLGLFRKVEAMEIRQEATQIDPTTNIDNHMSLITKLVEKDEIFTAIQVGRSSLKEKTFENSHKVFSYLESNVPKDHPFYYRIIANLAYSLIGLGEYAEAIQRLKEVHELKGEKGFRVWHAVALAYACFKTSRKNEYKTWLDYAKKRKQEYAVRLTENIRLYPEIEKDLIS